MTVLDPRTGIRPGDGRRQGRGLLGERRRRPREPRDRGGRLGPADGLGLQGVRARGGARARLLPRHDVRRARVASTLPLPGGGTWHVTNADGSGYGTISLRTATMDSVNTVYAQLIQRLDARHGRVETAETDGAAVLPDVGRADRPAARGRQRGARLERGEHARDGERLRDARDRRPARRRRSPSSRWSAADGIDPVAGGSRSRSRSSTRRSPRPPTTSCRTWSCTAPAPPRNIGRPQIGKTGTDDNHDNAWFVGAGPAAHRGGVGRVPRGADPDGAAAHADHRVRRHVAGADLARLLMQQATASAAGRAPSRRREVRYVSVAVDITQQPSCLPNAYTLPQAHRDRELRGRDGARPRRAPRRPRSRRCSCRR